LGFQALQLRQGGMQGALGLRCVGQMYLPWAAHGLESVHQYLHGALKIYG
jgi:hypothetical protein